MSFDFDSDPEDGEAPYHSGDLNVPLRIKLCAPSDRPSRVLYSLEIIIRSLSFMLLYSAHLEGDFLRLNEKLSRDYQVVPNLLPTLWCDSIGMK